MVSVLAQDIEPRAYSNAPVGVNFLIAGYAYTEGGLAFDPALPLKNPDLETNNALLAYARTLDLAGCSGKFDLVLPYTFLEGTADSADGELERNVDGLGDAKFRVSVNFYGAPALSLPEFSRYRQDLIVGVSAQISAPTGQHDESRLINIGSNRWSLKPEIGVAKALDRWTLEGALSATLFTDNDDFYNGRTREQKPLYSLQGHVIYSFESGQWLSVDVNYFTGGRTTIDDSVNRDLQKNWRTGVTWALPVDKLNSIKLFASRGVSARTGNNFDLLGIAWQHRWGGGL
ncbi:MAG TPA: transporter [Dongiaceae bacterium]|nr:transporter [Dongiaceae bacterium]